MKTGERRRYEQINTGNVVTILKITKTQVRVRYEKSGITCWYMIPTFLQLFFKLDNK